MTDPTTDAAARAYLVDLDTALVGLPHDVHGEILRGVSEELEGLAAAEAAQRIRALGDPAFIAAEARSEVGVDVGVGGTADVGADRRDPAWYPVVAALLVMIGGVVVPVLGSVAGLVMVWFARTWTRTEKWVATLTPVVTVLLIALVTAASDYWSGPDSTTRSDAVNPLIPGLFDVVWSSLLVVLIMQFVVGVWLLVRARRR